MKIPEEFHDERIDHKDHTLYMMLRRVINGEYAAEPVDFNAEGLIAGQKFLNRPLTPHDVIVDVGSASGGMIAEAALSTQTDAQLICVEPNEEAADRYLLLPDEHSARISFVRGDGEQLPLADESAQGVTMHNVIFRANDAGRMLREARRILVPGGFVAISSNARGHAYYRHLFERTVAEMVAKMSQVNFTIPKPPADGHYLEDLPALVQKVGGFTPVDELRITQETESIITRGDRLDTYLESIKFSAADTDMPPHLRSVWRAVVKQVVAPHIASEIDAIEEINTALGSNQEPYFADPIHRGMLVLRKDV